MYPSTNTRSRSTEKLTIYTEATDITSSSYPFVSKYYLDASLHSLNIQLKILTHFVEKKIEELKVFRNEMADIKSETHWLSEDTKVLKEDYTNFSEKIDDHMKKLSIFTTSFYVRLEKIVSKNIVGINS